MNWKLILRLSLVSLAMVLATIFFIPSWIEPIFWPLIYVFFAYRLSKGTYSLRFANGLALGLVDSVWITGMHDLFLSRYLAVHPRETILIDMVHNAHIAASPRAIILVAGTVAGLLIGVVIGVFTVVAGLMMKPRAMVTATE